MRLRSVVSVGVPAITFVLMTVVGSDIRLDDFRRLVQRSRLVWVGLLVPPLLLPAVAASLIALLRPPPSIAAGLLLVAACPIGGISNAFTFLAGGTTTLSVLLSAFTCLAAILTMPATGVALGAAGYQEAVAAPPGVPLLAHLMLAVALPAALGLAVRTCWPATTERLQPIAWRVASALLGLLIALIILSDVPAFVAALPHAVPLAACFILATLAAGVAVAHVSGAARPDALALAIGFATRNIAVATMTAVSVMGRAELAIFATAYFLTEVPLMVGAALLARAVGRRWPRRERELAR
jgi:BASS family bile acid:Na+ symporter